MVASATSVPSAATSEDRLRGPWRERLVIAGLSFALFLFGAGVMMAMFDLLGFWALMLTAAINLPGMLSICALTALALEVGATSESHRSRKTRVGQRTLRLASVYWAASGVSFLIAPVLIFFSQF